MAASNGTDSMVRNMEKYHEYLQNNYEGGCERFFSPTGFLKDFERTVQVRVQEARNHVFARDVDEAARVLEPVVFGTEGVFDLTAEPGTGKTSVLPFRFSSKKVVVALPTPFDAWSAYQMATGAAMLKLKGLNLGSKDASVVYTDSYLAANMVLSGFMAYDVLIVDECDSGKGVTAFLAEIKAPGKVLVRMSASHGRASSGPSKSFRVSESGNMPDVRQDLPGVAAYVVANHKGRSLVLAPDAVTAEEIASRLPEAKLVCVKSNLGDIARAIVNQEGPRLYVADDVCARGLNLNLDVVFDCQLVTEHGVTRTITEVELYQRKGRVGRNREGWYCSPDLQVSVCKGSDMDLMRSNIVRAIADVPQKGGAHVRLEACVARELMCAAREPYVVRRAQVAAEVAVTSSSSSDSGFVDVGPRPSSVVGSMVRPESPKVRPPSWTFYFGSGASLKDANDSSTYVVKRGNRKCIARSRHSSSGSSDAVSLSSPSLRSGLVPRQSIVGYDRAVLPVAEGAPYAVTARHERGTSLSSCRLPSAPPVMDLTMLTYDMDWPALITDRLAHGGDLPTLVPPASWRHTSSGGMSTNWLARLDYLATIDLTFGEAEFESVCRAWNKLVAQAWVKRTPGLSNLSDVDRLEFCARYFQSYFLLATAG